MIKTLLAVGIATAGLIAAAPAGATATPSTSSLPSQAGRSCAPDAIALNFSDSLDKLVYNGVELGGLSSLAYDPRSAAWVSAVDNHLTDPARIWFFRNLSDPTVVRDPLVLKRPDGTPYNGMTSDNEGLAVLPDGDYLVSSETEPSIRIFGRDGVQKASLPVPARFAVTGTTPAGQATNNATLEGLSIAPSGHEIIAAMEGALSGDVSSTGDANLHRFLVYDVDRHGDWQLTKQIAYRTDAGMRVPEVAAYSDNSFLVEEASFSATTGNAVELFAVTGLNKRGRCQLGRQSVDGAGQGRRGQETGRERDGLPFTGRPGQGNADQSAHGQLRGHGRHGSPGPRSGRREPDQRRQLQRDPDDPSP